MRDLFEPDVLASLLRQWSSSLRARNLAADDRDLHRQRPRARVFARRHGRAEFDRALIEDYLAGQAERWKPATVAFRSRSLQQFTKWLTAEDELASDPMAGMQAPKCLRSRCRCCRAISSRRCWPRAKGRARRAA